MGLGRRVAGHPVHLRRRERGPIERRALLETLRFHTERDPHPSLANPLAFADLLIAAVNAGADTLTVTAHGRATGDGPVQLETTGTAPGGAATLTDYWLIVVDANTVQLAATFLNAMDLVPLDLTSAGTGSHSLVSTDDTRAQGAEAIARTCGTRTATVRVMVFGGTATGDTKPRAYLDRMRAAAALPGLRAAMVAQGVAIASCGGISDVSASIASRTASLASPRLLPSATLAVIWATMLTMWGASKLGYSSGKKAPSTPRAQLASAKAE